MARVTGADFCRGDVWWGSLDPTQGSEIRKTRPCVILSHDTLNRHRRTVAVVPLSTSAQAHPPITVPIKCDGRICVAVVDQIRAVAKHRLRSKLTNLKAEDLRALTTALAEILEI